MALQQLDFNYLRRLNYKETNLKNVEVEIMAEADSEESCGIALRDGKDYYTLTEPALKHLCSDLSLPYPFTKTLRDKGRLHALPYLQKQLAQASQKDVLLVLGKAEEEGQLTPIISITDTEKLHYQGIEAEKFDLRLLEETSRPESLFDLVSRQSISGEISYGLLFKEPKKLDDDKGDEDNNTPDLVGIWKAGFSLTHSVLGLTAPLFNVELLRMVCSNLTYLPAKTYSYKLEQEPDFEDRWAHVQTFLREPPLAPWSGLETMVARLTRTFASYAEVKTARQRLMKLKVDKEDTETLQRVNQALEWSRIQKGYGIREMEEKPSRIWMQRASTPLKLFDIYNFLTKEATHAPNTIDSNLRQSLLIYGGEMLSRKPDLLDNPPPIDWASN